MSWKIVRNDQQPRREISNIGECPRFHKQAKITGIYFGRQQAKTDLQLTYSLSGYKCTLESGLCLSENECPLMPAKYL